MKQYFYIDSNNQQVGPISEEALLVLVKNGIVSSLANVWTEGLADWLPFSELFPEEIATVLPPSPSMAPGNDAFPKTIDEIQHGEGASSGQNTDAKNKSKPSTRLKLRAGKLFIDYPEEKQEPSFLMDQLRKIIKLAAICGVVYGGYYVYTNYLGGEDSVTSSVESKTKPKKKKRAKISKEKAIEELQELGIVSSASDIKGVVGSLALADACKAKNIKVTKLLIIAGADTKIVNEDRVLPDVIWDNQVELVELLLDAPGIDVNITETSGDGHTPLSIAAKKGNTEIVKLLLAAPGIDVNKEEKEYNLTPLAIAAEKGHTEIVKLLLSAPGININPSHAPLARAARKGHTEIVKLLLAAPGIDVNKGTALVDAVETDQKEVVKLLLAVPGIDVNKNTPLAVAAAKGLKDEVRLLLAVPGVDVNKEGHWNGGVGSPLSKAVILNQTEIVRILLTDSRIKSEPEHAINAMFQKNVNMAKMLLAVPGIDVNQADSRGLTFLGTAAYIGSTELVELLLNKPGIDVNKQDEDGRTPLVTASQAGHEHIVKLLLSSRGVDVNKSDVNGNTPLHFAVGNSHSAIVELLLASPNIEVNKPNKEGITPLRAAYIVGHKLIYKLLRNAGGKLLAN